MTDLCSNRLNSLRETDWISYCRYKEALMALERSKPCISHASNKDPAQRTDAATLLGLAATAKVVYV